MKTTLRSVDSWRTAWLGGFLPWLRAAAAEALRDPRPALVLAPASAELHAARALALEHGLAAPGIHFTTLPRLRDRLAAALAHPARHPLREHLRLLLTMAAEQESGPGAAAVAAAPDSLLRAIDVLGAGGWDFAEAGPSAMQPIVRSFRALLGHGGFRPLHETDRALLEQARIGPPVFARACVVGFDAAHWPAWPLLAAAVHASAEATVHLRLPHPEAHDLDALWIGTWEEEFGEALPLAQDAADAAVRTTHFLVGEDAAEQARAIVQQAIVFLADRACTRLAILLPGPGALARRVAALLAEQGVPHFDAIAHTGPGPLAAPDWEAWLALQENPRLPPLLAFLNLYRGTDRLFAPLSAAQATRRLRKAFGELLLDDPATLARWNPDLAAGIAAVPVLPAAGPLRAMVAETLAACSALGWPEQAAELHRLSTGWVDRIDAPVSRRGFVRWLSEAIVTTQRERTVEGGHPYSRTHLLPAAQAGAQTWSHLIFGGLNEGQWPPAFDDAGWVGEAEIAALNARIRRLNRRATRGGRQGEGHETVLPGKTLCLGPAEQRMLVARDFRHALAGVTAVAAAAGLTDEAAPERTCHPGDFLVELHHEECSRPLSQAAMHALRAETARWLAASALWPEPALTPQPAIAQAYNVRRDPGRPFGEFEFARSEPPLAPACLPATDWEKALSAPSLIWMKHFLGVAAPDTDEDATPWNQTLGIWVHRWLSAMSGAPSTGTYARRPPDHGTLVRQAAAAFRERVEAIAKPPEWWFATWEQARQLALTLAAKVAAVEGRPELATEWKLPATAQIDLGADGVIALRGCIDLILAASADDLWVIDFKTGSADALKARKLTSGDGLQIALYALALAASGATKVGLTRLTRDLPLASPQLQLTEIDHAALPHLWRGLAAMGASGVFGARGALRDEFSFQTAHPLATLEIDPEILEAKWAVTHPDLALES